MAAAEQDDEQLLDDILQPHDDPAHLGEHILIILAELLNGLKFILFELSWLI